MSLWGLSLVALAQSAREEIHLDPALAAGKYYAYQATEVKLSPVPEGYVTFLYFGVCPSWFPLSDQAEEI